MTEGDAPPLLFDSDVLIDSLRGREDARAYLRGLAERPLMSAVTLAELYAGVREGAEREALGRFIAEFEVIPVDGEIAVRGGLFQRDYRKSHNTQLPDALIAATAESRGAVLVTLNKKHFPMVGNVVVPYRKA